MKNKNLKIKRSLIVGSAIFVIGIFLFCIKNNFEESYSISTDGTGITVNEANRESQDLNVLVIEINPIINNITNKTLYPNNNGHPKVSEYFGHDLDAALNEMVEDLEFSSHGYLNIHIANEYLNEYPTYTSTVTLKDGTTANRLDEETYLEFTRIKGTDKGDWYNWIFSDKFAEISANSYTFDYKYIIDKYDLINRRNKGDFDQVWLLSIDPTLTYETIMIGNNPYWINAPGYVADCQNFQIANISISRRDANLHALAHGVEGIMTAAFHRSYYTYSDYTGLGTYKYYKTSYSSYEKDSVTVSSLEEYNKLNLWEKFTLGIHSNAGNYTSIGNVHYPYNGTGDYDYTNTTKVYTNWRDWLNYPNISGNFVLDNNNAWLTNAGNATLGSNENKDPDRLFMRFWFYLMPHITGYTKDGYINNWWKYFYSLDFVSKIQANGSTNVKTKIGNYVPINCSLIYNSEKIDTLSLIEEGNNIQISNQEVLGFKDGYVYAKSAGTSNVTLNYDGKSLTYFVTVEDPTPVSKTFTITFDKNTAVSIGKTSDSCTTTENSCTITMPSITALSGYRVVGWSPSKTSTSTIYTPNSTYSISANMTLYAIIEEIPTTTFTVTFDKNNATSVSKTSVSCTTTGSSCIITMPSITAPSGYTVLGFSTSKTATSASYLVGGTYSIRNNMTLYAVIQKSMKTITITFDKNTATAIGKITASCNTYSDTCSIEMPSITSPDGYNAVGFATTRSATTAPYKAGISYDFSSDATLYAIIQKAPVTFTAYFLKNTALSVSRESDSCTTTGSSCSITTPTITPNTGYRALGFAISKTALEATHLQNTSYSINKNMIFYAVTKPNTVEAKTITITFDKNTALSIGATTLTCTDTGNGCDILIPSITPKNGYHSLGFATSQTSLEATYLSGNTYHFENDVVLYAITKENPSKTFRITFDKNSALSIGKTSDSCTTTGNSCTITMPTIIAPTGYKVVGWSSSKTATTSNYNVGASYSVTEDMTLYAIIVKEDISSKTISVTFNKNTASSISKTSASCVTTTDSCQITMPSITPLNGYTVVGWAESPTATAAVYKSGGTYTFNSNKTLYAITKKETVIKEITVTFNKNKALGITATELSCTTTEESCNITMPSITPLNGYTVVGWAESADATFATYIPGKSYGLKQNMTLYAIIKKNTELKKFTITFHKNTALNIEATELSCSTIDDSCEITMPSITANSDYNVVGWGLSENATTATYLPGVTYMISNNITLYAITNQKVSTKTFTVTFDKNLALSVSNPKLSCITTDVSCEITMPTITPNNGYEVLGWSESKEAVEATYLQDKSYSITKNMILYAIVQKTNEEVPTEISGVTIKTSNTLTGNCVSKAELVIKDANNKIVDKWISNCEEENMYHQIELPDGNYTLSEITTPSGYATPSAVNFTIIDNKIPIPLNIPHAPIQLCISKTTGSKKLDILETEYEMYDELGKVVHNFVLTDTKKCFPYTPVGNYTIKEIPRQTEYITSTDDLTIKVQDTSNVQEFTIKSEITVPKTAMDTSKKIAIIASVFMIFGLGMLGWSYYQKCRNSE